MPIVAQPVPQILRYPEDLGITTEYPHFLAISVHERDITEAANAARKDAARGTGGAQGVSLEQQAAFANTITGQAIGSTAASFVLGPSATLAGAVVGGTLGAAFGNEANKNKIVKAYTINPNPSTTIFLPAISPNFKYSSSWSAVNIGFPVTGTQNLPTEGTSGVGRAVYGAVQAMTGKDANTVGAFDYYAMTQSLGGLNPGAGLQQRSGVAINPRTGNIFTGNKFRTFKLSYKFLPKNRNELETIYKILYTLKKNMLAEYSENSILYPSEFQLTYYFSSEANNYVEQSLYCALTDLDISYGDGTNFVTFNTGAPSEINVTMDFVETEIYSKQSVEYELAPAGAGKEPTPSNPTQES